VVLVPCDGVVDAAVAEEMSRGWAELVGTRLTRLAETGTPPGCGGSRSCTRTGCPMGPVSFPTGYFGRRQAALDWLCE